MGKKPNFNLACEKANEILISSKNIQTFPFSLFRVIEEMTDFQQLPFSYLLEKGVKPSDVLRSNDAELLERNGEYIFFYNEKMSKKRLAFSGGHELGHYKCGHDIEKLSELRNAVPDKFKELYGVCEVEANFFAAEILMPEPILIELSKRGCRIDKNFLMQKFGVSEEAAEKRCKTLGKTYNWTSFRHRKDLLSLDDVIVEKFKSFIDSVAQKRHNYEYNLEKEIEMEKERQSWI